MKHAIAAASWLALLASCAGTETGNPSVEAQMGFVGRTSDALRIGLPADDAPIKVGVLAAFVASVDFHGSCDEQPAGDAELDDVGAVDLLDPSQNVRMFEIAPAPYCAATVSLVAAPATDVPADLAGRSIVLAGTRADGMPFRWETGQGFALRLMSAADAPVLVDREHHAYVVAPDVAGIFGGMDLSHAVIGADGIARLDAPENATIDTAIRTALEPTTTMHRDNDEDGALDTDDMPILHGHHP